MSNVDTEALRNTDDGDECPLCLCGTVEHTATHVSCCGECGNSVATRRYFETDVEREERYADDIEDAERADKEGS